VRHLLFLKYSMSIPILDCTNQEFVEEIAVLLGLERCYVSGSYMSSASTCWRGPFLAYMSPAVAPEMMFEQSLKLVSDFSSDFNTALHAVILKYCKYF